jgi:ABC-2 type transport system ATP-binding protein
MLNIFKKNKIPLKTKGIYFSYDKENTLKNINLIIKNNQILSVVGRSGEGKSTFLNLIVGVLTKKYKGSIKIMGFENYFAKEDIGFVPQEISFIPDLNLKENILFFGKLNGLNSKQSLKSATTLMKTLQLKIPLERYPYELSGGQRVRLNIILSFLHLPKLMILDEPFVGLDYSNRKMLWNFLRFMKNRKRTIILTTHMLTEAEMYADQIILLHEGKILAKGKLDDICKKLNINLILEIKFNYLSKTNEDNIKKYCFERDITIMDSFNNHFMFSIEREGKKSYLIKFLDSLKLEYNELSFRKPNLDEITLKVDRS